MLVNGHSSGPCLEELTLVATSLPLIDGQGARQLTWRFSFFSSQHNQLYDGASRA
jgi:hypothetical protein